MTRKFTFAVLALAFVAFFADAGPFRNRRARWQYQEPQYTEAVTTAVDTLPIASEPSADECEDALDEVNAIRRRSGLAPFLRDALLTRAAHSCARFRAARLMEGHTSNDFAHLPEGATAHAAGCAAWPQHMGFGACCVFENWTYAGAAWVIGKDGRRYCHLYVR